MKSVAKVLLLLTAVVFGAIYIGESLLPEPYGVCNAPGPLLGALVEPGIIGPDAVEIGELARMETAGEKVKWDCIPQIADGQTYGENGTKYVASFRKPGVYTVIAAVYLQEEVHILQLEITVEGPPEPVVVVPPTPPGPEPDPFPINIVDPVLVEQVATWCKGTSKRKVKEVAQVFVTVSSEIASGRLSTTGEIINRTAILNKEINLVGMNNLMTRIQTYLTMQADSGSLVTLQDHLTVWKSIAQGLNQYAGS